MYHIHKKNIHIYPISIDYPVLAQLLLITYLLNEPILQDMGCTIAWGSVTIAPAPLVDGIAHLMCLFLPSLVFRLIGHDLIVKRFVSEFNLRCEASCTSRHCLLLPPE